MNHLDLVIESLSRLPGLGKKSASRMAYWLLESDQSFLELLGGSISELKNKIHKCSICGNYTEEDPCRICRSDVREKSICVVESPRDVHTIESTGEFGGYYHVLNGVLAPLDGVGPEELGMPKFFERVKNQDFSEVVIATNPTLEGDATAHYILRMLKPLGTKVTRIASGLAVGGDLEYADKMSISRAFRARGDIED